MIARKTFWIVLIMGLVVVGLPVAGNWFRGRAEPGFALDGGEIVPAYRVRVVDGRGDSHLFCCVACARIWLQRQPAPPRAVAVTDEESGEEIDASEAWYVRSSVVTTPTTGNRVHVFRNRADAEKHADAFGGVVLPGSERPFP